MNSAKFLSYNLFNPRDIDLDSIASYIIQNNIIILPAHLRNNHNLFDILTDKKYLLLFDCNFDATVFDNVNASKLASYIMGLSYSTLPSFLKNNFLLLNELLDRDYYFALECILDSPMGYENIDKDKLASYIMSHQKFGFTFDKMIEDDILCQKLIDLKYPLLFKCGFSKDVFEKIPRDRLVSYIVDTSIDGNLPDFIMNDFSTLIKIIKVRDISFNTRNSIISNIYNSGNIDNIATLIKEIGITKIPLNYFNSQELLIKLLEIGYEGAFLCEFSPTLFGQIDREIICDYIIKTGATFVPDILRNDNELFRKLLDSNYLDLFKFELGGDICKNYQDELIRMFLNNDITFRIDNSIEHVIFQNQVFLNDENISKVAEYLIRNKIIVLPPSWCFKSSSKLFSYLYDMDIDYLLRMTFDNSVFESFPIEGLQEYYRRHPQMVCFTLNRELILKITSRDTPKVNYRVVGGILLEQNRIIAGEYIKKYSGLSLKICKYIKENGVEATFSQFADEITEISLIMKIDKSTLYQLFTYYYNDSHTYEQHIVNLIRNFLAQAKEKYASELTKKTLYDIRDNYSYRDSSKDSKFVKKNKRINLYLKDIENLFNNSGTDNYIYEKMLELGLDALDISPALLIIKVLSGEEIVLRHPEVLKKFAKQKALNRLRSNYARNLQFIISDNLVYTSMIIGYLNGTVSRDDVRKILRLDDFIVLNDIRDVCNEAEAKVRYEGGKIIFDVDYVVTKEDIAYSKKCELIAKNLKKFKSFLFADMNQIYPLEKISVTDEDTKVYVPNDSNLLLDIGKIKNSRFEIIMKLLLIRDSYNAQKSKEIFDKLFIDEGIIYAVPFLEDKFLKSLIQLASNIELVYNNFSLDEIKVNNIANIIKKVKILQYSDIADNAILGEEVIAKIAYGDTFIYSKSDDNRRKRIEYASKYAALSSKKMISTIPYFSVSSDGFTVSRYNRARDVLISGIDTDSCFRIFGNDHDFLLYTLFNKNGIVIKITDENGEFIGRCSGFRNGNVVYFNQARTIYDDHGSPTRETNDVMKKFHKAMGLFAKKLIDSTKDTQEPIEHVLILKSYGYSDDEELPYIENHIIPYVPMNVSSPDYQEFLDDDDIDIQSANKKEGFTTDYQGTGYDVIILASADGKQIKNRSDIVSYDASAIYCRPRKKVRIYNGSEIDENIISEINEIRAKDIYWGDNQTRALKKKEFKPITSLAHIELLVLGEDYYFMIDKDGNMHELCLLYDDRASGELEEVKKIILGEEKRK